MVKAAIVYLVHGDENLPDFTKSVLALEKYFNARYRYPIVVFHEQLSQEAQEKIARLSSAPIHYEKLTTFLDLPDLPGLTKEQVDAWCEGRDGGRKARLGYRQMCRFFSYGLYTHPALADYDYYWRFDDDSFLLDEIPFDPFAYMEDNGLIYGYRSVEHENVRELIGLNELWEATKQFAKGHKLSTRYLKKLVSKRWKGTYTGFNYYNNFEINKRSFWVNHPLMKEYFSSLDTSLGFYKYRWGDANVRAMSVGLFLKPSQVHHFKTIGYRHNDHFSLPDSEQVVFRKPASV